MPAPLSALAQHNLPTSLGTPGSSRAKRSHDTCVLCVLCSLFRGSAGQVRSSNARLALLGRIAMLVQLYACSGHRPYGEKTCGACRKVCSACGLAIPCTGFTAGKARCKRCRSKLERESRDKSSTDAKLQFGRELGEFIYSELVRYVYEACNSNPRPWDTDDQQTSGVCQMLNLPASTRSEWPLQYQESLRSVFPRCLFTKDQLGTRAKVHFQCWASKPLATDNAAVLDFLQRMMQPSNVRFVK